MTFALSLEIAGSVPARVGESTVSAAASLEVEDELVVVASTVICVAADAGRNTGEAMSHVGGESALGGCVGAAGGVPAGVGEGIHQETAGLEVFDQLVVVAHAVVFGAFHARSDARETKSDVRVHWGSLASRVPAVI